MSIGFPILTFAALAVTVVLFVWKKGERDALIQAVDNYKKLADSYKDTIAQLENQLEMTEEERDALLKKLAIQQEAMDQAIDAIIAGFERAGFLHHTKAKGG
jgi:septal ring factor EnvC (AmiA/AmiB activator)